MVIDDYTFVDALFMTVITVSTVGFEVVNPLNPTAKIFTVLLILSSIGVYMYAGGIITKFMMDGQFLIQYKHNKVYKKISEISDHVIVCGYGRNGRQSIQKLIDYKKEFVVIESDKEKIEKLSQIKGLLFVEGDATEDETLKKAGVKHAYALITTLPNDAENMFVVLSARQYNKDMTIISRASKDETRPKLKIAGATNVIMPDRIGGDHMASLVVTPDVVEFLDSLSVDGKHNTNMIEVKIDDICDVKKSMTIKKLDLRRITGATIIGLKTFDGDYIVNPDADMSLSLGSKLIILGSGPQIKKVKELLKNC